MDQNTKHLLRLYVPGIIAFGFLGWMLISLLQNGTDNFTSLTLSISFAFALGLICFLRWRVRGRILQLYRQPNPFTIAEFYRKSMRSTKNGTAMAAYCSALAFTLYGHFESARAELAPIDWEALPPLYQGFERYSLSLIALFEIRNHAKALALGREAREMCLVSDVFPGSKESQAYFDTNISINRLLIGESAPELIAELESRIAELQSIWPAFPAWALAIHYGGAGDTERTEKYKAIVRGLVPYCKSLNDFNA